MFSLQNVQRPTVYACLFTLQKCLRSICSKRGQFDYDLIVIGGGSGGYLVPRKVLPMEKRYKMGSGRNMCERWLHTKKLMHQAAQLGESIQISDKYGWNIGDNVTHSWETLVQNVQNHVKSLNWGHRVQLHEKQVKYFNAKGSFQDKHTIKLTDNKEKETLITGENIVIAVGGRPRYPENISGAMDYAISSDDIFSLSKPPGKTLVVGASYVALECAGFLTGLGFDTTVMVRSVYLRGFDKQMGNLVAENMRENGTRFISSSVPTLIEKRLDNGLLRVEWKSLENGNVNEDNFETVFFAIGREPEIRYLQLKNAGVEVDIQSKKIIVDEFERTCVDNIYALGDVIHNRPELTPVAIMAGKLLAKRLFDGSNKLMDYNKIPTTVFTPLEYSTVGLSEDDAVEKYGEDKIEIFHAFYKPLEYTVGEINANQCYIKVICCSKNGKILGIHFLGPHAGEVMQGFAVALSCGLTYDQLCSSVGIHPTSAEEIVKLNITKRSGKDPHVTGC